MADIRSLVNDFTKHPLFKNTAKRLSKFDQAVLLGPATLIADIICQTPSLNDQDSISVLWLAPSGNEIVDDCKWVGMVSQILGRDIELSLEFVGNNKPSVFQGPNPKAAIDLTAPNLTCTEAAEFDDSNAADILIVGHSNDALDIAEWKQNIVLGFKGAVATILTYSPADNVNEIEKWNSLGVDVIHSICPEYAFNSKSEEGSKWCFQVDFIRLPIDRPANKYVPTTNGWLQKHSGECGTLNPISEPCSTISGITPIKGGASINGVYLIDDLVLIPSHHLLIRYEPNTTQIEFVSSVCDQVINDLPDTLSSFSIRYNYALQVKLKYFKIEFEKDTPDFVQHLDLLSKAGAATSGEHRQLAMHQSNSDARERQLRKAVGKGCPESLVDIADLVRGVHEDNEESIRMLKVASSYGNALADFNLSVFAQEFGEMFSDDDALKYLSSSAKSGLPFANYFLGIYYLNQGHMKWGLDHLESAAMFGLTEAAEMILQVAKERFLTKEITKKQLSSTQRKYRQFKVVA